MLTLYSAPRPYLLPVLLGVLLSLAALGRAATLNVPTQYPTIQAAITASLDGDTVLVADGTYSGPGNRDIDFGGKNITVTSRHGAASTPWHASVLATGPDGLSHILWTNPDGRVILWNVNSAFGFTYHVYGPYNDGAPNTPWSASAVSVGLDNMTHLLWNNPDGKVILWNLDTSFNFTLAAFGPYTDGSASTPWNATALATGPDGLSHLLWTNPDNRVFVWGVDSAFHFTNVLYGPYTDGVPQNVWSATAVSAGP